MAKLSGKNLYVSFGGTNISGSQRTFSYTHTLEQADATAGADDYRNFVNTVKTIEATCEILVQDFTTAVSGGSAIFTTLALGAQGTLIWAPEGTATGKPKFGFLATVTDQSADIPFDGVYMLKPKFTMAGTALAFNGTTDKW